LHIESISDMTKAPQVAVGEYTSVAIHSAFYENSIGGLFSGDQDCEYRSANSWLRISLRFLNRFSSSYMLNAIVMSLFHLKHAYNLNHSPNIVQCYSL
jgi:hypothetical protein